MPSGHRALRCRHDLFLVLPDVFKSAFWRGHEPLDEVEIADVFANKGRVAGVGHDNTRGVDDKSVAARAEAQGIDQGLGDHGQIKADGDAAKEFSVRPVDGVGRDGDEAVAMLGGNDRAGNEGGRSGPNGGHVVPIRVGGSRFEGRALRVAPGDEFPGGVEGHHRTDVLEAVQGFGQDGLGYGRVAVKALRKAGAS